MNPKNSNYKYIIILSSNIYTIFYLLFTNYYYLYHNYYLFIISNFLSNIILDYFLLYFHDIIISHQNPIILFFLLIY